MPVPGRPDQHSGSLRSELLAMSAEDQAAMAAFLVAAAHQLAGYHHPLPRRRGVLPVVRRAAARGGGPGRGPSPAPGRHRRQPAAGPRSAPGVRFLPGQYELDDQGQAVFRWSVDQAALDQRRVAIGLPLLAADLARVRAGGPADEIGPEIWEPWPTWPA